MGQRVIILGAGFAGLSAADAVRTVPGQDEPTTVTLVDRHSFTTMVPSLPDLAGTRIPAERLTETIRKQVSRDIKVVKEEIREIDFIKKIVSTDSLEMRYDYLVVALGSVTNFFGFDQHLEQVHKLDSLEDAQRIAREFAAYLENTEHPHAVVAGGGYTGLELGCNLRYSAAKQGHDCALSIVEREHTILPGMPDDIRTFMEARCRERSLELLTGRTVETFDGKNVGLSDGTRIENAFLCWATGTTFGLDVKGKHETIKDGRIVVDKCLRVPQHPEVYAAGDAAAMDFGNGHLRKAVNFSIYSGRHAGKNISRALRDWEPLEFSPTDLGWVIPFCNSGSGKLFSKFTVKGKLPLSLHYLMCGYRNYNLRNRLYFTRMALRAFGP